LADQHGGGGGLPLLRDRAGEGAALLPRPGAHRVSARGPTTQRGRLSDRSTGALAHPPVRCPRLDRAAFRARNRTRVSPPALQNFSQINAQAAIHHSYKIVNAALDKSPSFDSNPI